MGASRLIVCDTSAAGHADFGGEVERTLSMVDGVVLVVDATEGPMPQTKFVLTKALQRGLRPIVVLNKSDRPTARPDEVNSELFDLFCALDCTEEQLDFAMLHASAKEGWAVRERGDKRVDMHALLDTIIERVPPPNVSTDGPFSMLVTTVERDHYLGRVLTGRIYGGVANVNDRIKGIARAGGMKEEGRIQKILQRYGISKAAIDQAVAGDIVRSVVVVVSIIADHDVVMRRCLLRV